MEYNLIMEQAMRGLIIENKPYRVEAKIKRKSDGKVVDILVKAEYNTYFKSVYGTIQDITQQKLLENDLKKSLLDANRFREALDNVSSYVYTKNKKFQYTYANEKVLEIFNCPPSELEGKTDYDFFDTATANALNETDKFVLDGNKSSKEIETETKGGQKNTFLEIKSPIYDVDGITIIGIMGISYDISERKQLENQIRTSEEKFKLAFMTGLDAFYIGKLETGLILEVNDEFENVFGYSKEESLGKTSLELGLYNNANDRQKMVAELKANGFVKNLELAGKKKGGEDIVVSISSRIFTGNGQNFILGAIRDITAIKKIEDELKQNEEKFRLAFMTSQDAYYLSEMETGAIVDVNPAFARIFGHTREETVGKNSLILQLYHNPDDRNTMLKELKEKGEVKSMELLGKTKSGELITVSLSCSILQLNNKEYFLGILRNITERKNSEEKLSRLNRIYSFISKINELILYCNDELTLFREACNIAVKYGKLKMSWIGVVDEKNKKIIPFIHAGFEDNYLAEVKILSDSKAVEGMGPSGRVIREGTYVVCNDIENDPIMAPWKKPAMDRGYRSSIALPIKKGGQVMAIYKLYTSVPHFFSEEEIKLLNEVTDNISFAAENIENERLVRENAKKMVKDEEQIRTLSLAIEQSPVTVVITDLEGNIIFVNPKFTEVTGYTSEEVIGHNPRILNTGYTEKEEYNTLWQTIKSGKNWEGTFLNKRKSGELFWESAVISPVKNSEGEIINYLAVKEDITDLKLIEAEKGKILSDLMQHNKNLEQFAYIVSHNLRTPVANILGIGNLLKMDAIDEKQKELYNANLITSIEKLDQVITDLNTILQVKNQVNNKAELIQFEELVKSTIDSISQLVEKEKVSFVLNFKKAKSIVSVKSYIHSILLNLITNSIKYRKTDVLPVIKISTNRQDDKLILTFEDNGLGIDLKTHGNNLFGLYKRFNTEYAEGKGMGLYMVKSQVESLGGTISVSSTPNQGTIFTIQFNTINT